MEGKEEEKARIRRKEGRKEKAKAEESEARRVERKKQKVREIERKRATESGRSQRVKSHTRACNGTEAQRRIIIFR